MNAATESTGTEGWTASTMEPVASLMTGTKLFTGSYGTFLNRLPLVTKVLAIINRVWPSGAARAATWVPILPLAPGLLSTTTGWPQCRVSSAPSARARISMPVPGLYGTMMVIGRPATWAAAGRRETATRRSAPTAVRNTWLAATILFIASSCLAGLFPSLILRGASQPTVLVECVAMLLSMKPVECHHGSRE